MNEVSARVMPVVLERLCNRGVDLQPLFEGLQARQADLEKGVGRFGWDDFAVLLERAAQRLDGTAELQDIGVHFKDRSEVSAMVPIFGVVLRPRLLVKLLTHWWGPMLFTCVQTETNWLGPRELELTMTIPGRYRDSPEFFHVNTGSFTTLGYFSGGAPAAVALRLAPRRAVYHIVFPQTPSIRQRAAMAVRSLGGESALMNQLMSQQLELNAALRELQDQEYRYRLLVENSSDVIWRYDLATGSFTFASRSIRNLLGYAPDNITALRLSQLVHPHDVPRVREAVAASASGAGDGFALEVRMMHRDGHPVWVEVRVSPQRNDEGDVVALQGITRDISARREAEAERLRAMVAENERQALAQEIEERRRIEAELLEAKEAAEASNRLKSSILANLSHEIRTPLTALIGFAQILDRSLKGTSQEAQARIIHGSGRRLLALLDNMLELARADAGKLVVEREAYPLRRVVAGVTTLMSAHAAEKGIALAVDVPDELRVVSDPRRDEQVLLNVIGNALRYSDGGTISIAAARIVEAGTPWAEVKVADTGIGISAEFLPFVFDEFRQEATAPGRRQEGSGLGLALAKRFVERVGGSIALASQKGRGTTVTIRWPAA